MDFISILSIFVLACFVGYYVVWSVTPALHTPLMAVTNAISSVIIVGALVASAAAGSPVSKWLGLGAVVLASVNIFGGFAVTGAHAGDVQEEGEEVMEHVTASPWWAWPISFPACCSSWRCAGFPARRPAGRATAMA
jgi:NAD(P) transhydrogenase subunit alpha